MNKFGGAGQGSRIGRLSRRRAIGAGACGLGAMALLAACGGKRSNGQTSTSATQAGKPRAGGQINVRVTGDPFDWDLSKVGRSIPNSIGLGQAYDSLLSFEAGPKLPYAQMVLQAGLAQRWETPDSQTYTYTLRPGIKFADLPPVGGRALSSADVKWSFEYWSRSGEFNDKKFGPAEYASLFEGLESIETPDPATAVLHFKTPFAPFLNYSASPYIPVAPHEIYDQDGNLTNRVVGTGPWQLDVAASQKGTQWIWKRNANYWQAGRPYIDQITWLVIQDDAAGIAAFRSKQLDILGGPSQNLAPNVAQQLQGNDVVTSQYVDTAPQHLYMNVRKAPLNDVRIRKAIGLSIDRAAMVKTLTDGKGGWALAGAQPDTFSQAEIQQMLKYDPAQAKQLVTAAGFPNGVDLEMIYPTDRGAAFVTEVQLFQAQLKRGGINVSLQALDKGDESSRKKKGNFQLEISTKALLPDVDSYLYSIFYPTSRQNYAGVDDPELSKLLVAQRQETDPQKRQAIVKQAVTRINVDMVWALALYYSVGLEFWHPRLQDYAPHAFTTGWPLLDSWLAQ